MIKWEDQAVEDAVKWAKITVKDENRLKDFHAGFRNGWKGCLNTLKMHNMIKE
jgi:hypothetical protein